MDRAEFLATIAGILAVLVGSVFLILSLLGLGPNLVIL